MKAQILVIDGQGGQLGSQIIRELAAKITDIQIAAVGTNAAATAAMLKAGADEGATGENPVIVACRQADVIIGPIGILVADGLLGEITPAMSVAIGQSEAKKLLLPLNLCNNIVVGTQSLPMSALIADTVASLRSLIPD
jgi:hypothetical protein